MGLSHDGGDFRIHYDGGAFSPGNLIAAVTTGKGFDKPRVFGLGLIGIAFAFTAGNYVLITVLNYYFPYLYCLGAIFGWAGMWLAITGQPMAQKDGSAAPAWGRYGLMACIILGVLAGLAMVSFSWEAAI